MEALVADRTDEHEHRESLSTLHLCANAAPRNRLRLMFVLALAPTKIGGVEKFLKFFATALDTAGWDTVLCFDGPISDQFREYIAGPNVLIERLDNQGPPGLACAGALWRLLRKHKPQIFVYAFNGALRIFPWMAKMAGCKRVFFNDHSSRPNGQRAQPLSFPKRIVARILTAPLTAIISVAEFTRKTGEALGVTSAPAFVVQNGIEVHGCDFRRRVRFRRQYGISNEDLLITQVAWMVEEKGVDHMLRAAAMLLRKHSGIHFLFVGEGSCLREYQDLATQLGISGAVTFTGLLTNPTAMGVYDASDIYCQPSVWQEACPIAVLEAMSAKLPVIASYTGGLPELVQDGLSGILVPVGGSQEICAALEQLAADADLRRSMGEAGYKLALNKHRIEDTARKYVDIFLSHARVSSMPSEEEEPGWAWPDNWNFAWMRSRTVAGGADSARWPE
jgi:glycosyltransferase involved in cell wall biosynthesis